MSLTCDKQHDRMKAICSSHTRALITLMHNLLVDSLKAYGFDSQFKRTKAKI
jgi:hypothetical protein